MSRFIRADDRHKTEDIERLRQAIREADAIVIGAGAGLSTAAGYVYDGERFERYFPDFKARYGIEDIYSGGFYPYEDQETLWAWWSRQIWINRYAPIPKDTYARLADLVRERDYFVITTNVDHCFQKAGFDKKRLFYTQGDYGLWQCSEPCHDVTHENEPTVRQMLEAQGWQISAEGTLEPPETAQMKMRIPSELVPHCPVCGRVMTMNLRSDDTFVEDEGWHAAAMRYTEFLRRHSGLKVLLLELGVGFNTPGIIKYPFWQLTARCPDMTYACLNHGEAGAPEEIAERSILINGDFDEILRELL